MTNPTHDDELVRLRRIEGQIRGVQKMIEEGRYCIDILQVLSSVRGAIKKVEEGIFERHLDSCVKEVIDKGSLKDKKEKLTELLDIVSKFRK
jgi:DNA-binding FrmR family transcriptional regulator